MSQADVDLERMLAGMADDVPPMPADFHDNWMSAVRAEAGQGGKAAPAPVSQLPRILSAAAVFVFLVGGTLIYRAARKTNLPEPAAFSAVTEEETAEKEERDGAVLKAEKAGETAREAVYGTEAYESAGEAAYEAEAYESAGEAAYEAEAYESAGEANDAGESDSAAEAPMIAAGSAGEATVKSTAEPTPEIRNDSAAKPAGQEPETSAANGLRREGIGGFFADMGDFLLEVWPYLLIAVVPAAVALVYRKRRKK